MATSRFTPVVAVNASAGVIPRYAVVEPTGGVDVDGNIQVGKPTRANGVAVLFNGPVSVPVGGVFSAWPPTPAAVAGVSLGDGGADPGDLPLAAGAAMGTRAGDWFLRAGQSGFRSVAPPTLGAVQVVLDFGGTSSTTTSTTTTPGCYGCGNGTWKVSSPCGDWALYANTCVAPCVPERPLKCPAKTDPCAIISTACVPVSLNPVTSCACPSVTTGTTTVAAPG